MAELNGPQDNTKDIVNSLRVILNTLKKLF